jgi:hypothetical protein
MVFYMKRHGWILSRLLGEDYIHEEDTNKKISSKKFSCQVSVGDCSSST